MKRLGVLLLVMVMLAACAPSPAEKVVERTVVVTKEVPVEVTRIVEKEVEAPKGPPQRYVLVVFLAGHENWNQMLLAARDVIEGLGLNAIIEGPQGPTEWDAVAQLTILDQVAVTKPDGIIITSADGMTLIPGIERAVEQGITVQCLDLKSETPLCDYCGTDFREMGIVAAHRIVELCQEDIKTRGKCEVALTEIAGVYSEELRKEGLYSVLKDHPEIEIVADVDDKSIPEMTVTVVGQILAANPNVRVLHCLHGQGAAAMATAVKNAGLLPNEDVYIIGNDLGGTTLDCIKAGECDSTVGQDMYMMGAYAFLNCYIKRNKLPKHTLFEGKYSVGYINPGTYLVTAENLGSLRDNITVIEKMFR